MKCIFCQQKMEHSSILFPDSHYTYNHYRCKDCVKSHTSYYLIISNLSNDILVEQVEVDEICLDQHPNSNPPFTDIFIERKLACTLPGLPYHCDKLDPEVFKNKIKNYIIFS